MTAPPPDGFDPSQDTRKPRQSHTIASLRLDLAAAKCGQSGRILPEGFRALDCGRTYPLPTRFGELQALAAIPIPRGADSGTRYLRRALAAYRRKLQMRQSASLRIESQVDKVENKRATFRDEVNRYRDEIRIAVDGVKKQAEEAAASMTSLFELGRKCIDGQLRAHLSGETWQDEKITAAAARDCFRMVTQTVGRLGLPSEERETSRQAIIDQAAAALDATRDAIALAPGSDPDETIQ